MEVERIISLLYLDMRKYMGRAELGQCRSTPGRMRSMSDTPFCSVPS